MTPTKDELKEIQKTLAQISETQSAKVNTVKYLRPLGYIFIRGDFSSVYTVHLTRQGKSLIHTKL